MIKNYQKNKFFFLQFLFLFLFGISNSQPWNAIGPNDNNRPSTGIASYGDVAVSPVNNDVYVASANNRYGQTGIDVKKWNGTNWINVGGFIQTSGGGSAEYCSVAVEPLTGVPFVGYIDRTGVSNNSMTVKKFVAGAWEVVGTEGFGPGYSFYSQIKFAPNGTLYAAFIAIDGIKKPFVKKWDGTNWVDVGDLAATLPASTSADEIKFTVSNNGTLFVSYTEVDNINNYAIVKKWNGNVWETVGNTGFLGQYRSVHSIAVNTAGVPYITGVYDPSNISPYRFAASVKKLNTTTNTWEFVGHHK